MENFSAVVARNYNKLPDVFDADLCLERMGREKAVNTLLSIIKSHNLHDYVSVRLLHKHNYITEDELMIEDSLTDEEGFSLVTQAKSLNEIKSGARPNSWHSSGEGFIPVEYSYSHLLKRSDITPDTERLFFRDFSEAVSDLKVSNLLGIGLNASLAVEAHRPCEDALMVELSAYDARANILRFARRNDVDLSKMVETFWTASGEPEPDSKETSNPDTERATPKACRRICPSVQNPPVHQGTYIHNRT